MPHHKHRFVEVAGTHGARKTCRCGRSRVWVDTHALSGEARRQARAQARRLRRA
jgi:hypothetical protein